MDEISALFFGRFKSIRSYQDKSNGEIKFLDEKDEKFFNVLLTVVKESDIYAAWDKDHRETIENFEPS